MIECSFVEIPEFLCLEREIPKLKLGRYHGSKFRHEKDLWMIAVYIEVDWQKYLDEGKTKEQIINECLEYLNQPLSTRKNKIKYRYGLLKYYSGEFKVKFDKNVISCLLLTNEKNNKSFWNN